MEYLIKVGEVDGEKYMLTKAQVNLIARLAIACENGTLTPELMDEAVELPVRDGWIGCISNGNRETPSDVAKLANDFRLYVEAEGK